MTRALAAVLLLAAASARADDDAFQFFKEEAQVVTASRRPEPALRAPAAVDVVTAEEIKAYGFKEIWDVLRYRAGMDVLDGTSIDGNRALVSSRGFTKEFVSEMQVLVDGRSVYNPLLGGVYWKSLPVQMEDIQRIEIVRGPNAALYGSNAGLGVINIITKKPAARGRAAAGAWGGTQASVGTFENATAGGASAALRISHEYRSQDDAQNSAGASANDFVHTQKVNVRGRWSPDAKTEVEFLGGGSWLTAGIPGVPNSPTAENTVNFQAARATRALGGSSGVEASLSRSEMVIDAVALPGGPAQARMYQYDAEALHHFTWLDERVTTTWGGDWRFSGADSDQTFAGGEPRQSNRVLRGFMHHSIRVAEPLTFVGGASIEDSYTGGAQPAWQAAFLYEPVEDQVLRASYSKAPTLPSLFYKNGNFLLSPGLRDVSSTSIDPEQIASWELGWNGRFLDGALKPALALYYMSVRSLDFSFDVPGTAAPVVRSVDNRNAALARGVEASVEHAFSPGRAVFANYTWEEITDDKGPDAAGTDYTRSTPQHKFNVGGRAALGRGATFAAILGYKDHYHTVSSRGTSLDSSRSFRLDARAGWEFRPGWELFAAGSNLLQPYTVEYADGSVDPRTVRGGLTARFGP
ncbi:MAG TPA: TonB-dependent receptor [Elusimicrobiota bacterium]|nr:TonB-dependent receptor [Elusimicrobiota bacterium]